MKQVRSGRQLAAFEIEIAKRTQRGREMLPVFDVARLRQQLLVDRNRALPGRDCTIVIAGRPFCIGKPGERFRDILLVILVRRVCRGNGVHRAERVPELRDSLG